MFIVTVNVLKGPKNSIYNVLKDKLGREPTDAEIKAEIDRILGSVSKVHKKNITKN